MNIHSHARRLVIDLLKRTGPYYLVPLSFVAALAFISQKAQADGVNMKAIFDQRGVILAVAWFQAFLPPGLLNTREMQILPLSRRSFWISEWFFGAPMAGLWSIAAVLVSSLISGDFSSASLTIMCGTLYGGCASAVKAAMGPVGADARGRMALRLNLYLASLLGGAAAAVRFAPDLPMRFSDLHGPWLNVLIAAAGITVASYFYQPPITARASRGRVRRAAAPSVSTKPSTRMATGMFALLQREVISTTIGAVGMITMLAVVNAWSEDTVSFPDFWLKLGAAPFARPTDQAAFPLATIMLMSYMSMSDDLINNIRRMRTLPVSRVTLAAFTTHMGLVSACIVWTLLLALHVILFREWPATLRPELFMLIAGGTAMCRAARLALPVSGLARTGVSVLFIIPVTLAISTGLVPFESLTITRMICVGAAAFALAYWINYRAITTSSRLYKQPPAAGTAPTFS